MNFVSKLYLGAGVAATQAAFASGAWAQTAVAAGDRTTDKACGGAGNALGQSFLNAVNEFIGSPVFYIVMFLLALSGLYAAIVKQETAGWYAVGFAAIGAATPQIFKTIIDFSCGVLGGTAA